MLKTKLQEYLQDSLGQEVPLEHPSDPTHGDFSTNIALTTKGNPLENAKKFLKALKKPDYIEKIEIAKPGFINFWISKKALIDELQSLQPPFKGTTLKGRKILVEFAHPNTHKLFHIGHLRNITTGECLSRLLENQGAKVIRANYQGDIGLHIAKTLWGLRNTKYEIRNTKYEKLSTNERVEILSQAYVTGNKAYEENESAKAEIIEINKKLYAEDKALTDLWQETKRWSLEYFDSIYTRLGTKFDRLYFESEVAEPGKEIVIKNIGKIFEKSEAAIVFKGEKYGLHTRVFVNSQNLATYEAKDLGLAYLQMKEFLPDLVAHVVAPEQSSYFKVLFKVLELLDKNFQNKEKHIVYGWVRLKEGKMSSREGNVVEAETVLNEVNQRLQARYHMDDEIAEAVSIAAVKYSLLKPATTSEIAFDIDESIDLEGNSGPYIQYTYARTQSVLGKATTDYGLQTTAVDGSRFAVDVNAEELSILRHLYKFPEVVQESAANFAPNPLCNFLYELAQKYNAFYNTHRIIGNKFRLSLTTAAGNILKRGLYLLGISAPKKM